MKLDLAYHIIKIGCGCVNIFWPRRFWFTQRAKCIVRVRACVWGIKFNARFCCLFQGEST